MLFNTPTQFAVLALLLIAGWLFGLASASGGQRWRDRYAAERDAHAATRQDLEARHADANLRATDAERGAATQLAAANARVVELERENDRMRAAVPVAVAPTPAVTSATPIGSTTVIRPSVDPRAYPDRDPRV